MNLETDCGAVNPMSVQFVNETDDIVNGTTCWGSNQDSGDSDDGNESPAGMVTSVPDGGSASRRPRPGKKTMGRVKIRMEYIRNKLRRYTTFSKRKTGIMKKAYELSALTGTQVMLLVASETGHVYTFATRKLQPMITSENGKALIQTCLNSPDLLPSSNASIDQPVSQLATENVPALVSNGGGGSSILDSVEKKETLGHQVSAHSAAIVKHGQVADLRSVLSDGFSKRALLPTSVIGADVTSCSGADLASSSLMVVPSADCTDQVTSNRPLKDEIGSLLHQQSGQHLYYQLPGTNQLISIPVEQLKENKSPTAYAGEPRPLAILNVGSNNPTPSTGPAALMYSQGIVFAPSYNNTPTDGYFIGIPNTPSLAVSHEGLSHSASSASQHYFTVPLSAPAQMFQSANATTSATVESSPVKALHS